MQTKIENLLGREPIHKREVTGVHIFSLPFRVEIGRVCKFECIHKDDSFDIWIYNEIPLVRGRDSVLDFAMYTSKVLVHSRNVEIDDPGFSVLSSSVRAKDPITTAMFPENDLYCKIAAATNRVLAACNAVSPHFFSGGLTVKMVSELDLIYESLSLADIMLIAPEEFCFTEEQAETFLRKYPIRLKYHSWTYAQSIPSSADILEAQRVLDYLDQMLFYELMFDAKSKAVQWDFRGALIQTSMALESLIWLVLDITFSGRFYAAKAELGEEEEINILSDKRIEEVIEKFGRELGLTLLVQTLPYLLLKDADRPKPSEIEQAVKAISWRNKLIHSKKTRSGAYYWREFQKVDFAKHYANLYSFTSKLGSSIRREVMK